jgi:hypothetical protein
LSKHIQGEPAGQASVLFRGLSEQRCIFTNTFQPTRLNLDQKALRIIAVESITMKLVRRTEEHAQGLATDGATSKTFVESPRYSQTETGTFMGMFRMPSSSRVAHLRQCQISDSQFCEMATVVKHETHRAFSNSEVARDPKAGRRKQQRIHDRPLLLTKVRITKTKVPSESLQAMVNVGPSGNYARTGGSRQTQQARLCGEQKANMLRFCLWFSEHAQSR